MRKRNRPRREGRRSWARLQRRVALRTTRYLLLPGNGTPTRIQASRTGPMNGPSVMAEEPNAMAAKHR